jgi:glutathione S-transferase
MLTLYAHPFSSYCWKVLIALWENDVPFAYKSLADEANGAALARLWPIAKMPILLDGETLVVETSIIIEHLQLHHAGPVRLIPDAAEDALAVRKLDRLSDNYLMNVLNTIVGDRIRPEGERDTAGVEKARASLDTALAWWDGHIRAQVAAGYDYAWTDFSLADCAAAPALFYVDWVQPFGDQYPALHAYRERLLKRPSVARAVDEARPFRHFFPFGDPGRD